MRRFEGTKVFFTLKGEFLHLNERDPTSCLEKNMSTALYAVGYLLLVVGVSCLAHLSHIPDSYIFAIDVVMLGIGVVTGLENVRQKDSEY
jgi:hypothetical protein